MIAPDGHTKCSKSREPELLKTTKCQRCGDEGIASESSSPSARPFRKALKGYCTPCVVCKFFQDEGDRGIGHALPPDFDPENLRLPHLQEQFARVLAVGCSELLIEQINWDKVIEKWRL